MTALSSANENPETAKTEAPTEDAMMRAVPATPHRDESSAATAHHRRMYSDSSSLPVTLPEYKINEDSTEQNWSHHRRDESHLKPLTLITPGIELASINHLTEQDAHHYPRILTPQSPTQHQDNDLEQKPGFRVPNDDPSRMIDMAGMRSNQYEQHQHITSHDHHNYDHPNVHIEPGFSDIHERQNMHNTGVDVVAGFDT